MRSTITRPDSLGRLNDILSWYGHQADVVMITPDELVNFSRKSSTEAQHAQGFGTLATELRVRGIALPRAYQAGGDVVVSYCAGAGVSGDDTNPNPDGMGLVLRPEQIHKRLALGVTFADAPGAFVVHVPTGMTAAVSGIGHILAKGTVGQTVELLSQQVSPLHHFRPEDLWVILAPGAREGYMVNDKMINEKLAGINPDILDEAIVRDYKPGADQPHSLDLAFLFRELWAAQRVPADRIDFDERNTLTDPDLPSKRRCDAAGLPFYSSGILAGVVSAL